MPKTGVSVVLAFVSRATTLRGVSLAVQFATDALLMENVYREPKFCVDKYVPHGLDTLH